jgi:hypothetical protein
MTRFYRVAVLLSVLLLALGPLGRAQRVAYETAYGTLKLMLESKQAPSFSKAVFTVENAWYDNKLAQADFDRQLAQLAGLCQQMVAQKQLQAYRTSRNWAIFMLLTQQVAENEARPYAYDFEDFTGNGNYAHTFVTRLLKDRKGNCLSLPLLYKCLAQQLGTEARLTLGPSHAWIRHVDEKGNWTNVELTSGQFPSDGLMMTELGVSNEAIRSGAYGKELSEQEALSFMLTQLALGYQHKTGHWDAFTDKCADLSIRYFAPNVVAYMIKANRLTTQAQALLAAAPVQKDKLTLVHQQFEACQAQLRKLGAGSLSSESYNQWINSMKARPTK